MDLRLCHQITFKHVGKNRYENRDQIKQRIKSKFLSLIRNEKKSLMLRREKSSFLLFFFSAVVKWYWNCNRISCVCQKEEIEAKWQVWYEMWFNFLFYVIRIHLKNKIWVTKVSRRLLTAQLIVKWTLLREEKKYIKAKNTSSREKNNTKIPREEKNKFLCNSFFFRRVYTKNWQPPKKKLRVWEVLQADLFPFLNY